MIYSTLTRLLCSAMVCLLIRPAMAGLEEGIVAYQSGNVALAVQEFTAGAEAGDSNCQFNLALMYEQGIGVLKDEKQAVAWYLKSAEQGNSNSQFNLGVLYENGRGTPVDFAKAQLWYRKASAQGDALAIGNLGMLYLRGDGVNVNKIAGIALLLRSATMDNSPMNNAKINISKARGLSTEMIVSAQALADAMGEAPDLLVPLDEYLNRTEGEVAPEDVDAVTP
ncbi:tetratricopeptide repeat protein [Kiritimatiellota bacterium B12222]|nr:tetratricopeptide repeat protein [Kiritimatiellota bacterium B12222]